MARETYSPRLTPRQQRALMSGARDKPVKIERRTAEDEVDDSGFPIDVTWSQLVALEWMHRETMSGRERIMARQTSAPVDTRWTMGYRPDMDPDLVNVTKLRRLIYENRVYDIEFAETLGSKDGIVLTTISSMRTT
jgi:hypothetical protein